MSGIAVVGEPKESVVDYVRSAFSSMYSSLCSLLSSEQEPTVEHVVTYKRFDEADADRAIARRCENAFKQYSLETALYRAGRAEKAPELIESLDVDLKEGDPYKIFAPFGLEFMSDVPEHMPLCEFYVGPKSQIEQIETIIRHRLLEHGGRAIIGKGSAASDLPGVTSNKLWPPPHHYVFPTKDDTVKSESL